MSENRTGHCHCGAVTVTVPASAAGVIACHCEDCQRLHGNYFALIAAPTDAVSWTGTEHIRWYASSAGARRAFCTNCGSRLAKETLGSGRMLVSVGLFGKETGLQLRKHLYGDHRPDWYPLPPLG